jgi:hypothetical protein
MTNYDEIIGILNSDNYYSLRYDVMKLVNDEAFLKRIIKIHNPFIFDRFIKMCEFKIDTAAIYEERNKFVKKTINELNQDNIYSFFELEDMDKSRQDNYASRYLSEYIISYYFGDNFYNFMTNFFQMTNYLNGDRKNLVSLDHIKLYEQFINISKISLEDKIKLFNSNLNNDLMGMFYDDINTVRVDSHKRLVEASLKLNKDNGIYQSDLSDKCGVDVYYLNGESFYGFVRCLTLREENMKGEKKYVFSQKRRLGYSFSFVSGNEMGTIDSIGDGILLYYDDIDYQNIMYVHHTDMHTGIMNKLTTYISDKENEIKTPSGLIANTVNYNEVYIKPGKEGIKPTAVICFNDIDEKTLAFAKKYNLAILMVNKEKYKHDERYDDDYTEYTYML